MLRRLFQRLIAIGETDELSAIDKRKLHIINGIGSLGVAILTGYIIFFSFLARSSYISFLTDFIGITVFATPIFFNAIGKSRIGRIAFLFGVYVFFSLMCLTYGKVSGVSHVFVLGVILPHFLIDKKPLILLLSILSLGLFSFFEFYYFHYFKGYAEETVLSTVYIANNISLFVSVYVLVKQFEYETDTYQKMVLQQNENLEIEKQKSDKLLLNILPAETAQELKEKGFATPKHYELITVLFTDFKGFTSIAEKISPAEVIENLNTCFLAFDEICDKYGLEKIKTIGDAYMCAGGLPVANTTNPVDVVLAGLEMQQWMKNWIAGKQANGQQVWELRLGIHSGEAVAGVVGKNKFAYDIWGDTVNLASRMESSGEVGKVNISGATYKLVKDCFECVYRGKIQAKNKGEVEMYFVEEIA